MLVEIWNAIMLGLCAVFLMAIAIDTHCMAKNWGK